MCEFQTSLVVIQVHSNLASGHTKMYTLVFTVTIVVCSERFRQFYDVLWNIWFPLVHVVFNPFHVRINPREDGIGVGHVPCDPLRSRKDPNQSITDCGTAQIVLEKKTEMRIEWSEITVEAIWYYYLPWSLFIWENEAYFSMFMNVHNWTDLAFNSSTLCVAQDFGRGIIWIGLTPTVDHRR